MVSGAWNITIEGQILIGLVYHPIDVSVNRTSFVIVNRIKTIEKTSEIATKGYSHSASWIIRSNIIADTIRLI